MEDEVVADTTVQSAYDRIANPDKVQEIVEKATETPPTDDLADLRAQVGKIPDVLKQLNDVNGRYGRLTQRFEEMQARKATPDNGAASAAETLDVEEMLKGIKDDFGEDGSLYPSLKTAFSKLASQKSIAPEDVKKMLLDEIAANKQAEVDSAMAQLTEARPTWTEDRATPEFKEWKDGLTAKERARLDRSKDPEFVVDRFDDFDAWKAKKASQVVGKAIQDAKKQDHAPSKRLANAVLPTNGTKPKVLGEEDKSSQIRAAYERVAGARLR